MPLNRLAIDDYIRTEPSLKKEVDAATELLIDVIGESAASRASATWNLSKDERGRQLVQLVLEDPSWKSTAEFASEELGSRDQLWWRFYRLWGEHLQKTSQQQLEQLHQSVLLMEDE